MDEWMFNPLPSYEVLDEKEVIDDTDTENPVKRISYRVRHVVVDMDKVIDPRYSRFIQEFSNTKDKLSIKTYDRQAAIRDILRVHGKLGSGGKAERENTAPNSVTLPVPALLAFAAQLEAHIAAAVARSQAVDGVAADAEPTQDGDE